jgi:superfamily I DNA and/or RNA helicase
VQVSTLDSFQGQEQDVVVFSAVRSNAQGRLGFLAEYRKLNVAATRARWALCQAAGLQHAQY